MSHTVRFRKESQRDFQKQFSSLCQTKSSWQAWSDFVELSAISISNVLDRESMDSKAREERYMQIIRTYLPAEQKAFSELLFLTVEALEAEPDQDFLGEMFMGLELGSHWHGQFFTPYNVCRMMAEMQLDDAEALIKKRGWLGINDPCCGAGALLIAARNALARRNLGHTSTLFVAQDIDRTAALMCYIQLSLLGCAGYVVIADSIRYPVTGPSPILPCFTPEQDVWFIPWEEVLDSWEAERNYWYMNYYQECNQPLIEGDRVRVFETVGDLLASIGKDGFRCPCCGGVSTSPYECNSGIVRSDKKVCDWKVYGLFRGLGKDVFVYCKDKVRGERMFMPIAWEKEENRG